MSEEAKFTIFCMESYKEHRSITGNMVAQLFDKYDVYRYLSDFYDVLHTTGVSYINSDIDAYLASRNAEIPVAQKKLT